MIKICGVSTLGAALTAVEAGTDALGFIFAESRRKVSASQVKCILDGLDRGRVKAVGVFVNADAPTLREQAHGAGLDAVQLSGDESPSILDHLDLPAVKSFRFGPGVAVDDALRKIDPWLDHQMSAGSVHLDAFVEGVYGGSGHRADWNLASAIAGRVPVVLAGGLTPLNVTQAIKEVGPFGVDTSSGVETAGTKDPVRIAAFVTTARGAFNKDPLPG